MESDRREESADLEKRQITIPLGGTRISLMSWSAVRMATCSAVNKEREGKEKDFVKSLKKG